MEGVGIGTGEDHVLAIGINGRRGVNGGGGGEGTIPVAIGRVVGGRQEVVILLVDVEGLWGVEMGMS